MKPDRFCRAPEKPCTASCFLLSFSGSRFCRTVVLLQKLHDAVCMKSACYHKYFFICFRCPCNLLRHILLAQKAPVCFQLFPWGMASGQITVDAHLPHKLLRGLKKPADLKIFFPQLIKIPKPGLLTEQRQITAPAQQVIVVIGLLLSFGPDSLFFLRSDQDLPIRQVNKRCVDPAFFRFPKRDQLRRKVQKRIIAFIVFLLFAEQPLFVFVKIIEGHRRLCLLMCKYGNLFLRVLRAFNQNAVRTVFFYRPFQMPGACGTVVPDGEI